VHKKGKPCKKEKLQEGKNGDGVWGNGVKRKKEKKGGKPVVIVGWQKQRFEREPQLKGKRTGENTDGLT